MENPNSMDNSDSYKDLVSTEVGIEDDIGIFGNLMETAENVNNPPEFKSPVESKEQ